MKDLDNLVSLRAPGDYQRDDFDDFLKKIAFHYITPSIHIAGTNGKGSTASYIASIYQHGGYKVGLFSSPALQEINEMITINGEMISDEEITSIVNDHRQLIEKYNLSAFEVETLIAMLYFDANECDLGVIECGMGGLIDATNVFVPLLSIITSVSLEHTAYLGKSITEVAEQKAGIIKREIPVLVGDLSNDVMEVVSKEATYDKSPVYIVSIPNNVLYSDSGFSFDYQEYVNLQIQSIGLFSVDDACLAIEAINILKESYPVSEEAVADGLFEVNMPARMEPVHAHPLVICDGAHNPEAMENLMVAIEKVANSRPIHVIFACFKDKNFPKMLSYIGQVGDISLTTFDHPRARQKEDFFLFADEYIFYDDCVKLIMEKMENFPDDIILVTGSLAFAGYISTLFKKGELA